MTQVIDWDGDDLCNLLTLSNQELYQIYDHQEQDTIRRQANKYRKLLRLGLIEMPERLTPYTNPEDEKANAAERRDRVSRGLGKAAGKLVRLSVLEEHLVYHQQLEEALEMDGRVEKATFSSGEHTGYIKNSDNEIEYTEPLKAAKARFEVNFNTEPKWPVPTRVESIRLKRQESAKPKDVETCMIFPDVQIPFADSDALSVALAVMMDIRPDKVVFLGDLLDLSAWSKYVQMPEFAGATQAAVVEAHQLLASIRKALPKAEIQVMSGNHEARLENNLLLNAKEAYGLKRADQLDSWPVMSVPYLCAFDQLDVEYVPGYPANRVWLNKNLQIRHGNKTGKKGQAVRGNIAAEKVSTITGHDHRLSSHISTVNTYEGGQQIHAYGAGCLCRIDGHVPSVWQGRDLEGAPITQYEDWNQGFIIATYDSDNFNVEQIPINTFNKYQTMFRGRMYEPKRDEPGYA